jgi:ATP-dependent helicase/nuclease subunit A
MARRMHEASKKNLLFIEKAFVFSESADKLFSDGDETELLVQGIIDAFFIEDDGIVLLDYKTDRVKSGDELLSLYKKQLYIYADAIEKAYDMKVKESCLYSFCLDETVFFNHNV